jgi:hypothetical protein
MKHEDFALPEKFEYLFPKLFDEFREKRFGLLWRGSRDGFCSDEFHRRCNGHQKTLTVILDTHENIFGGFTPLTWESSTKGKLKAAQLSGAEICV